MHGACPCIPHVTPLRVDGEADDWWDRTPISDDNIDRVSSLGGLHCGDIMHTNVATIVCLLRLPSGYIHVRSCPQTIRIGANKAYPLVLLSTPCGLPTLCSEHFFERGTTSTIENVLCGTDALSCSFLRLVIAVIVRAARSEASTVVRSEANLVIGTPENTDMQDRVLPPAFICRVEFRAHGPPIPPSRVLKTLSFPVIIQPSKFVVSTRASRVVMCVELVRNPMLWMSTSGSI